MSWLQAHLTVEREAAPEAEELLESLGALSVTLSDAGDEPMLEPLPGATPVWSRTRVTGLFGGDTDETDLRRRLASSSSGELVLERLEDQPWERAWLDHFHPMRFGKRLWVAPSGSPVDDDNAVVVTLDPGLAFGTGTHPTTALCLRWLDAADLKGRSVIDYGCGSGVWAVAALKLGAAEVVAVDHDPQALLATRENARRNGVAERLRVQGPDASVKKGADLVLANILANVLVDLASLLTSLLRPGGLLVLSGILQAQVEEVVSAYGKGVSFIADHCQEKWVLLEGVRQ